MRSTQSRIEYVWTNDEETLEITFAVSYTMDEYHPQTWDEPASGGGPVDVSFELASIRPIRDPSNDLPEIPRDKLNPRWVANAEKAIDVLYDRSDRFRDRVQTAICEEEYERSRDCRW